MSILECYTEHFLRQPAVDQSQLFFIVHVLEVVINDRYRSRPPVDHIAGDFNRQLGPLQRITQSLKFPPGTTKCKTKEIADLAGLVAREPNAAIITKLQAKVPELSDRLKLRITFFIRMEDKVQVCFLLASQMQGS